MTLAKFKWVGDFAGNWRIERGTVIHKSWAGIVGRKKGSATAYTAGCQFLKKAGLPTPPPPPPPPPPAGGAVFWNVAVAVIESPFRVELYFGVEMYSETAGFIGRRVEERVYEGFDLPPVTITVVSVNYTRDSFSKTFDICFGSPESPYLREQFTLTAPPFNDLEMPGPVIHEQWHTAL